MQSLESVSRSNLGLFATFAALATIYVVKAANGLAPSSEFEKHGRCVSGWQCVRSPVLGRWGGGCELVTLFYLPLSSVLSRFNCVIDNLHYSPSKTPIRLIICLLLGGVVLSLRRVW